MCICHYNNICQTVLNPLCSIFPLTFSFLGVSVTTSSLVPSKVLGSVETLKKSFRNAKWMWCSNQGDTIAQILKLPFYLNLNSFTGLHTMPSLSGFGASRPWWWLILLLFPLSFTFNNITHSSSGVAFTLKPKMYLMCITNTLIQMWS